MFLVLYHEGPNRVVSSTQGPDGPPGFPGTPGDSGPTGAKVRYPLPNKEYNDYYTGFVRAWKTLKSHGIFKYFQALERN